MITFDGMHKFNFIIEVHEMHGKNLKGPKTNCDEQIG